MLAPEACDLFLGGGRGGGKSYALALLALRHVHQHGKAARILYVRQTYKGLSDFELLTRDLFGKIFGTGARYNQSDHTWKFPGGGVLELGQLEGHADYAKYQGRSFTLLLVDEAGQFSDPGILDLLRSNLRGGRGVFIRVVMAANPGGPGHHWIAKRYVFKAQAWVPFHEVNSARTWIYAPSTFKSNQFIDQDEYLNALRSSCPSDPELLRAWVNGDWAVARGAYFASVIDERRNAVAPWKAAPPSRWLTFLAHDFGSSAPSVTYWIAESPGEEWEGCYYPRGSLIVFDELATCKPDRLNEGLGWTVPILSEEILSICKNWKMKPIGVADDAIFAKTGHGAGSIAEEFMRQGVRFMPAKKSDRISGWQTMRRLLEDAGKPDVPGLYISRGCEYFWGTIPYLARDPKRIEDLDSSGPDHGADALRYGCLRRDHRPRKATIIGL